MSATFSVVKPISQIHLAPGSLITIPQVSWQEFEAILGELGERRSARIAYSNGNLEIMVPLPEHEIPRDLISDIVKILLKSTGQRYHSILPEIAVTQIVPAIVERSWKVGSYQALEELERSIATES